MGTQQSAFDSYPSAAVRTAGPLLFIDSLALVLSVVTAVAVAGHSEASIAERTLAFLLVLGPILFAFLAFGGLYPGVGTSPVVEFRQISIASGLAFGSYSTATLGLGVEPVSWSVVVIAWPLTLVSIPFGRFLTRSLLCRFPWWGFRTLVVGNFESVKHAYQAIQDNPAQGLRAVLLLEGAEAPLEKIRDTERIHYAVLATSEESSVAEQASMVRELGRSFPRVMVLTPESVNIPGGLWMRTADCSGLGAFEVRDRLLSGWNRLLKRGLDLLLVAVASPALVLLTLVVAVLNRVSSPGSIFFGHERIGENGRRFKAWKFRTMVRNGDEILERHLAEHPQLRAEWERRQKLKNDPRVGKVGRWLRRTSMDELPQIWNVLRGEMSAVGPRPIIRDEVTRYGESFELYIRVRPGLTGLWQVSGRNDTTYPERVAFDSFYVRNWSVWLDLHILIRTFRAVLTGDGAS
ncbi:MAG: undecaprenyl-phosphate galactose phosphotransferase WbaP [Myxococcota bacterium]